MMTCEKCKYISYDFDCKLKHGEPCIYDDVPEEPEDEDVNDIIKNNSNLNELFDAFEKKDYSAIDRMIEKRNKLNE
jgi:hypothetical protein